MKEPADLAKTSNQIDKLKRLEGSAVLDCQVTRFVLHAMVASDWPTMINPTARDFVRNAFRKRSTERTLTFDEVQVFAQHALCFSHFSVL